ncbi:MAG: hypothetical protein V3S01_07850, partial [Dehalococcoidia bacterium]
MSSPNSHRASPTRAAILGASALVLAGGCLGCRRSEMPGFFSSETVEFTREDWTYGRAPGTKLASQHYVLYTTCTSKPFVDAMPGFLETCWKAYAQLVPSEKLPQRRLPTYLFKTRW